MRAHVFVGEKCIFEDSLTCQKYYFLVSVLLEYVNPPWWPKVDLYCSVQIIVVLRSPKLDTAFSKVLNRRGFCCGSDTKDAVGLL